MPKKGHTKEQILGAPQQYESCVKMAEICWKLGVSHTSFFTWKSKYGEIDVNDAQNLKGLEDENLRLTSQTPAIRGVISTLNRRVCQPITRDSLPSWAYIFALGRR